MGDAWESRATSVRAIDAYVVSLLALCRMLCTARQRRRRDAWMDCGRGDVSTLTVLAQAQHALNGAWQGETRNGSAIVLTLDVKGDALTGTLARNGEPTAIADGKVSERRSRSRRRSTTRRRPCPARSPATASRCGWTGKERRAPSRSAAPRASRRTGRLGSAHGQRLSQPRDGDDPQRGRQRLLVRLRHRRHHRHAGRHGLPGSPAARGGRAPHLRMGEGARGARRAPPAPSLLRR